MAVTPHRLPEAICAGDGRHLPACLDGLMVALKCHNL